jgi:hypothetical protein
MKQRFVTAPTSCDQLSCQTYADEVAKRSQKLGSTDPNATFNELGISTPPKPTPIKFEICCCESDHRPEGLDAFAKTSNQVHALVPITKVSKSPIKFAMI